MSSDREEERRLRAVTRRNTESIFLARQRAERDLLEAKEALDVRSAELAASLAMMQATLDSTTDGILVVDGNGDVSGYNARFVEMWQIPNDVLAARRHRRFLDVMARQLPDPAAFIAGVDAVVAAAPDDDFGVLELADGRVFERYSRVQNVDNRIVGRVWSYRDVTARAHYEAELREAKAQAETANRAKSAFLATMSHELRTPLNAIAGYAQILAMEIHGPLTADQSRAIERILASQRHLLGLIDEVLTHAMLEASAVRYAPERIRVQDVIASAQALLAPQAWAKGVSIETGPCDAELAVHADGERVHRILSNLLSNAVKFTPTGGSVDIDCARVGDHIRIEVRDSGIGIAADKLDQIFEPFMQVHSELTRAAEGTGLGLSISRALARGMAGDLTVQSEPGRGSTFRLELPCA